MKILITGVAGFAGSHLAELLLNDGEDVQGTILPGESTRNVDPFIAQLKLCTCDVRDADAVMKLVDQVNPDEIYHLAAIAFIPDSVAEPRLTYETNLLGTMNLFEAAARKGSAPRVLFVGSGDEYGLVRNDELPITEANALRPTTPYSVSKASASLLALQYGLSGQVHTVRARPFNHTGPRQSPRFVCSDFARQIVEAEKGRRPPEIHVGNVKPKRDFTDVRDIVRAYRDILRKGLQCEVYNICSGQSVEVGEILDILVSFSDREFTIIESPDRSRKSEVEDNRGDFTRLREATGWQPTIPLTETLKDLIDYWRTTG